MRVVQKVGTGWKIMIHIFNLVLTNHNKGQFTRKLIKVVVSLFNILKYLCL